MARHLLLAMSNPVEGREADYDRWLDEKHIPDLLNRTVSAARAKWIAEGFDAAKFTANPDLPDNLVNSQTFTPAAGVMDCVDAAGQSVFVTSVDPPPIPCDVPNMIGLLLGEAEDLWDDEGFNTALTFSGNSSKRVSEQDPNHPGTVSCDVIGKVKLQ